MKHRQKLRVQASSFLSSLDNYLNPFFKKKNMCQMRPCFEIYLFIFNLMGSICLKKTLTGETRTRLSLCCFRVSSTCWSFQMYFFTCSAEYPWLGFLDQVSPVRVKPHNSLNTMRVFMAFFLGIYLYFAFVYWPLQPKKLNFRLLESTLSKI